MVWTVLSIGQAKLTKAFRLPCDNVIHAVGAGLAWWQSGQGRTVDWVLSTFAEAGHGAWYPQRGFFVYFHGCVFLSGAVGSRNCRANDWGSDKGASGSR